MSYFNADIKTREVISDTRTSNIDLDTTNGFIELKTSGHNGSNAIVLASNSGVNETIEIHNTRGNLNHALHFVSNAGGMYVDTSKTITLDSGNAIRLDAFGDIVLDARGDITLDADGGNVSIKDGGSNILDIGHDGSGNWNIMNTTNNKKINFVTTDNAGAYQDVVDIDSTGNVNIKNGANSITFKDSLSNIGSVTTGVMDIRSNFINLEANSNVVIKSNGTQSLHFGYQDLRNDGVSGGEWKIVNTDTNSNIHLVTTDTNGAQNNVMVADSYGRVGIGTDNPSSVLDVNGTLHLRAGTITTTEPMFGNIDSTNESNAYISFAGSSAGTSDGASLRQIGGENAFHMALDFYDDGDDAGFSIRDVKTYPDTDTITTRFIVNRGGNVGIGTADPSYPLHVKENTTETNTTGIMIEQEGTGDAKIQFTITGNKSWSAGIDNSGTHNKFIIAESGTLGTSNILTLSNADANNRCGFGTDLGIKTTNPQGYALFVNGTGYINSGSWSGSDDRIKYNEEIISGVIALSIINQLQPQYYEKISYFPEGVSGTWIPTDAEWNAGAKDNFTYINEAGLIAQDIRAIPELSFTVNGQEVNAEGTQTPLKLNYNDIYTYHIAATKELSNQLDAEKVKTATLETDLTTEKAKTATLQTQVADLLARVTALENP